MPNPLPALLSLRERLEKADGPDREIDCSFACAFFDSAHAKGTEYAGGRVGKAWQDSDGSVLYKRGKLGPWCVPEDSIPHYTASLDSIVSLVERVRPGLHIAIDIEPAYDGDPALSYARLSSMDADLDVDDAKATAPTPALALCLALVGAMIAEAEEAE